MRKVATTVSVMTGTGMATRMATGLVIAGGAIAAMAGCTPAVRPAAQPTPPVAEVAQQAAVPPAPAVVPAPQPAAAPPVPTTSQPPAAAVTQVTPAPARAPKAAVPREPAAAKSAAVPKHAAAPKSAPAPAPVPVPAPAVAQSSAAPATASASRPAAPALDLNSLEQRLRDTRAIGVFTKLSLKNQVDDLLGQFRDFYARKGNATLADLHQKYDLLLLKVLSVLQNGDPALAATISASREAIWGILADPQKFSKL